MPVNRSISVVVTDLDDTLFDWVGLWHKCFTAMFSVVKRISERGDDELLDDFQRVFQEHGTTEYAFALEELPCLREEERRSGEDIRKKYASAVEAYRAARRLHLATYPTVVEGLIKLRGRGCLIIGYTESLAFYSNYRIRRLGLDGVLDYLFSPEDHDIPERLSDSGVRHYKETTYRFRHTIHRHTPMGELKPNARVLLDILRSVGANEEDALYVGDKLHKDVTMAKRAGVTDVHARYGESHLREEYELLKRVTHWTPEMVKKEAETTREHVEPSFSIDSFGELLDLFEFRDFEGDVHR